MLNKFLFLWIIYNFDCYFSVLFCSDYSIKKKGRVVVPGKLDAGPDINCFEPRGPPLEILMQAF